LPYTSLFRSRGIWCPVEDSVTQARPRPGLHARPFSSSRKVLKHLACWAEQSKKPAVFRQPAFRGIWCPGEDSNLHTLRHMDLNHARLPIPPPGHNVVCLCLCQKPATFCCMSSKEKDYRHNFLIMEVSF